MKNPKNVREFHQQGKVPSESCYLIIWLFLPGLAFLTWFGFFLKRCCLATLASKYDPFDRSAFYVLFHKVLSLWFTFGMQI